MFTRVIQGKRPRSLALLMSIGAVLVAAGLLAAVVLATLATDTGTGSPDFTGNCDVTVASNNTSRDCQLGAAGGFVSYIGSNDTVRQSSGTGLFDPFVRLQGSPTEKGYNTCSQSHFPSTQNDICPGGNVTQFDTKVGSWTHPILVSAIPVVDCNRFTGDTAKCWELFVDINDNNTAKRISLNIVELWFTTNPQLTGYVDPAGFPAASGLTKEYDFHGNILINDVNSGSGRGDLRYLVPTAGHAFVPSSTYFVLYSKWGTTTGTAGLQGSGTYVSDGGFEEWKVRKAPNLGIVKTANPLGPVSAGTAIGFDITVSNTGAADATNVQITDSLPAGGDLFWSLSPAYSGCAITGAAGAQTLNCTFATVAAGATLTPIHITSPTTKLDCAEIPNTASIVGDGSSTARVTVQCPDVRVVKTPDSEATGAGTVTAGSNAVFTIVTSNIGAGTAKSVTLTDNLPAGTSLDWSIDTDATSLCAITGLVGSEVLSCPYGDLASGASRTVIVKATTSAGDCTLNGETGDLENTASASATNEASTTLTNNSDHGDVNVQCPDVSVVKTPDSEATGAGTVGAGSDAVFTIVTSNAGPGTAKSVTTTDNLPPGSALDWSIDTDTTGLCTITGSVGSEVLNCPYGDLASGVSRTVIVKAATTGADCFLNGETGDIENTASTSATNESSTTLTNNSDHGDVNVTCSAIQILKESTKTTGDPPVHPLVLVAGAVFHVTGPGGYSADVTDNGSGDENTTVGSVCVSGLVPGEYTVTETTPPDGYGSGTTVDGTSTAVNPTDCGSHKPSTANSAVFTDPPLSDIQVNFRDGGSGETKVTSITCDNSTGASDSTAIGGWEASLTITGVEAPTTIVCTIVIDP